jgi:hypothetical protein
MSAHTGTSVDPLGWMLLAFDASCARLGREDLSEPLTGRVKSAKLGSLTVNLSIGGVVIAAGRLSGEARVAL